MTLPGLRVLRAAALAALGAAYLLVGHLTVSADEPSTLGAAVAVGPQMAVALGLAWQSRHRALSLLAWTATVALALLLWPLLEARFEWLYFAQHAGTFALMAIGFGQSLHPASVPVASRMARMIHGDLPPVLASYTRGVTVAWTLFFASMAAVSCLLFWLAPLEAWSVFGNLLTPVLLGAMFAGEYLARRWLLPPSLRAGFVETLRALGRMPAATAPAPVPPGRTDR